METMFFCIFQEHLIEQIENKITALQNTKKVLEQEILQNNALGKEVSFILFSFTLCMGFLRHTCSRACRPINIAACHYVSRYHLEVTLGKCAVSNLLL